MKTYGIKSADGKEFAFEIDNFHITRHGVARLVAGIPGCAILRQPQLSRGSFEDDEEFCEFELNGARFVAWEPWGDNNRYWIGPKITPSETPQWCPQIETIREVFNRAHPFLGFFLGHPNRSS